MMCQAHPFRKHLDNMHTDLLSSDDQPVDPRMPWIQPMGFPERLAARRKERALTQQQLAEAAQISVIQLCRYETARALPTLDALRRLAVALGCSIDALAFDPADRGPEDDLRMEFEAASRLPEEDQKMIRKVLRGLLLSAEAQRLAKA